MIIAIRDICSRPPVARNLPRRGLLTMNARVPCRQFFLKSGLGFATLLLGSGLQLFGQAAYRFDAATVSGLPARNIGSATMSGRIAALDAVEEDGRITVFVGAASGGVWKSVNGGTTYKPVFDREDVQAIGAVTVDRSNDERVWVGSEETWLHTVVSVGG